MLTPPTVWCALVPSRSQPDGFKLNYDPIRPEATCFKADPKFDYSGGLRFDPLKREMSSARAGPIPPVGSSGETAVSRSFAGPEKALEKVEPDLWGKW